MAFKKKSLSALGRISQEQFKASQKTPLIVVLDNIRSLHNVGAVFRTADSFRIEKIILTGITARPPHREIQKTALGATETVDWSYVKDTKDAVLELKKEGYFICALEQAEGSVPIQKFIPPSQNKIVLIAGNEVNGITDDIIPIIDACIEIPQHGTKHSLNVSIACGIAIWELFNKLNIQGKNI